MRLDTTEASDLHAKRQQTVEAAKVHRSSFKDPSYFESRSCPVCNSENNSMVLESDGGKYVRCHKCKMIFLNPVLSDTYLNLYYSTNHADQALAHASEKDFYDKIYSLGFENCKKLANIDSVLDIGCSDGAFISIVKSKSAVDVTGVEPSIQAINSSDLSARENIHHTTLESFQNKFGFNIVTCFQTIEHVNDLNGLVVKSKELLLDEGHLVFVCHDRLSLVNRILGERSPIFDIEHLQILNKKGVQLLLQLNGFVDVQVNTISNKYPIAYWLLLAPIPKFLKTYIDRKRNKWYLSWGIRIRVGNLLATGRKPSE